ncbi:MAG: PAS domain-containing protein, partial [Ruminiclostridium sp.]
MFKKYICGDDCEFFLENFLNSMRDGFMLNKLIRDINETPVNFEILEVNKAFEKLFKVNKESIFGKPVTEVFQGIDQEWIDICCSVKLDSISLQKDVYFKAIDKHFRVNIISQPKNQFIILFNDITELINADEALKKHFMLFEYAKDIIFYLSTDGSILDANKTAVEHYGYTKSELLSMKIQQIRDSSTMEAFEEQMQISASRGIVFESIHVKKDGTAFPVEVSSRTLDIHGELVRFHIVRDITERKKSDERIKYFANYDPLTGIYNRGYLMYQLRKTLEQANIEHFKFAVMLFDIDKFKIVNDTYGHHAGDEVLRKVTGRLKEAVRKSDIIGRLG